MTCRTRSPRSPCKRRSPRETSPIPQGVHAVSLVVDKISSALSELWKAPRVLRPSRVVPIADNYDDLGYPPDAPAPSERYARYVGLGRLLSTHTTAAIPSWLASIGPACEEDAVLVRGMVWRRDCVDRRHVGDPHQMDA